ESGKRAIVSNLKISEDTFADTVDLLDERLKTHDMPLSTAAHLSARFTYVSPAGTIMSKDGASGEERAWGRVGGGGYFENSGVATAGEVMQRMGEVADEWRGENHERPRVAINMILIRNDPTTPAACSFGKLMHDPSAAKGSLSDLMSPAWALLNARSARGTLA